MAINKEIVDKLLKGVDPKAALPHLKARVLATADRLMMRGQDNLQ